MKPVPIRAANTIVRILACAFGDSREPAAIPPLLLRRMSPLTRQSIAAAMECCRRGRTAPDKVRVVFASRHGEMATTVRVLGQLLSGEPLSPMDFSGSVHHTAAGYFSLVTSNRQPMHAVAAGEETFAAGFLDAACLLSEKDSTPVLLIYGDETLQTPFSRWDKRKYPNPAAILMAGERSRRGTRVRFSLNGANPKRRGRSSIQKLVPVEQFQRWWKDGTPALAMTFKGRTWRWQR